MKIKKKKKIPVQTLYISPNKTCFNKNCSYARFLFSKLVLISDFLWEKKSAHVLEKIEKIDMYISFFSDYIITDVLL